MNVGTGKKLAQSVPHSRGQTSAALARGAKLLLGAPTGPEVVSEKGESCERLAQAGHRALFLEQTPDPEQITNHFPLRLEEVSVLDHATTKKRAA